MSGSRTCGSFMRTRTISLQCGTVWFRRCEAEARAHGLGRHSSGPMVTSGKCRYPGRFRSRMICARQGIGQDRLSGPRADSKNLAICNTPRSSKRRHAICKPIGMPEAENPQQMEAAGCSEWLSTAVKWASRRGAPPLLMASAANGRTGETGDST